MVIRTLEFHGKGEAWDGKRTWPLITNGHPLDIKLLVGDDDANPTPYTLFGGYRASLSGEVLLLYRWFGSFDGQVRFLDDGKIQTGRLSKDEELWPSEWHAFLQLDEGAHFRLGGKIWQKLSHRELEQLFMNRVYRAIDGDNTYSPDTYLT